MVKITKEAALLYHSQGKPGKIEVVPTKPYSTQGNIKRQGTRAHDLNFLLCTFA